MGRIGRRARKGQVPCHPANAHPRRGGRQVQLQAKAKAMRDASAAGRPAKAAFKGGGLRLAGWDTGHWGQGPASKRKQRGGERNKAAGGAAGAGARRLQNKRPRLTALHAAAAPPSLLPPAAPVRQSDDAASGTAAWTSSHGSGSLRSQGRTQHGRPDGA